MSKVFNVRNKLYRGRLAYLSSDDFHTHIHSKSGLIGEIGGYQT